MAFQEIACYFLGMAFQEIARYFLKNNFVDEVFIFCKPLKILT
jgi:hypothetical protein